ncbi:DoxX family protein [Flavobacterium sp.]|uniref:DoxX family protein n=1 Tax=Flavobacterium sp. TaxID=239 RepID=UPI00261ED3B4|nr:DoxX family protein [Flavobacterium sp.]MDD2984878.1 DoxX family protein [Flavobacterium sp.]
MNNPASFFILLLLTITYLQSSYDKLFYWKDNVNWLNSHFSKTFLKNSVPFVLAVILILELITGILAIAGMVQLLYNGERVYGFYAAVLSCIILALLLFGQRLAKDYDGARTIVIYYIPSVLAVFWLN